MSRMEFVMDERRGGGVMQDALFDLDAQKNQTAEHWWLSWSARRYLLEAGAVCAGMEASFWRDRPLFPDEPEGSPLAQFTTQVGFRADVLAIMRLYDAHSRSDMPVVTDANRKLVTVAVDAKASRRDLRRGFDDRTADFNYIVAPEGMVKAGELPDHVGLLVCAPGCIMRRRARRVSEPRVSPDEAVWIIAIASAQETRRMRPRLANPFDVGRGGTA